MRTSSETANTLITVVRNGVPVPDGGRGGLVVSDSELRQWALNGGILRHLRRYGAGRLLTERLSTAGRPMLVWALRLMTRDRCYIADLEGRERDVTFALLARWSWQVVREAAGKDALLRQVEHEVSELERATHMRTAPAWNTAAMPEYLRTDLSFGVRAGGSVGHIAGVVNELSQVMQPPVVVTTAHVPTIRGDIETHQVEIPERFWNFSELPTFVLNHAFVEDALRAIGDRDVSFVYQRYSLNNYSGLRLASRWGVPFVLEYNGSEIWMSRHWGRPLKYEAIASRIELLNVKAADLIVVVSRAMRDELVARGVDADRVLVNPNAVDPARYTPALDGQAVRERYALDRSTVLGFISTFAPWHGATVLARAFVTLFERHPDLRQSVRLLMIGAGPDVEPSRRIIADAGFADAVRYSGLIPQEQGPQLLAACDVFVSPHVPNADGSPFFGSPTKLFEYMAMGKGIVASNLDQIGEILRHGETGWLVPPADPDALAEGLAILIRDRALRQRLGTAAREEALAHHTWRAHVRRTLDALEARVRVAGA